MYPPEQVADLGLIRLNQLRPVDVLENRNLPPVDPLHEPSAFAGRWPAGGEPGIVQPYCEREARLERGVILTDSLQHQPPAITRAQVRRGVHPAGDRLDGVRLQVPVLPQYLGDVHASSLSADGASRR